MRHHRLDFRQILFKTLTVVKVSGVIIRATCPKIYGQSFPPHPRVCEAASGASNGLHKIKHRSTMKRGLLKCVINIEFQLFYLYVLQIS